MIAISGLKIDLILKKNHLSFSKIIENVRVINSRPRRAKIKWKWSLSLELVPKDFLESVMKKRWSFIEITFYGKGKVSYRKWFGGWLIVVVKKYQE